MTRSVTPGVLAAALACAPGGRDASRDSGSARMAAADRGAVRSAEAHPTRFGLGRVATAKEIALIDLDVNPDGEGLPPGQGTAVEGAAVYASRCAVCHGPKGEGTGAPNAPLVGRLHADFMFANDRASVKTVGNYWPYATTLFDYIRRAMPQDAVGTLTADETYAVIAWILNANEIITRDSVMNARTLPRVRMPGRDHFVRDDRKGGPELR